MPTTPIISAAGSSADTTPKTIASIIAESQAAFDRVAAVAAAWHKADSAGHRAALLS